MFLLFIPKIAKPITQIEVVSDQIFIYSDAFTILQQCLKYLTTTSLLCSPQVFCSYDLIFFKKFTRKHLLCRPSFNKVVDPCCNFIKRRSTQQVFSCEFCKIFPACKFNRQKTPSQCFSMKLIFFRIDTIKRLWRLPQHFSSIAAYLKASN